MTAPASHDRYLLLPMQPTANGSLHLGHASGPYLRADVLARHLRRAGHQVAVMCGSDVYENWILLDSHLNNRTPAETCARFHRLIEQDLADLDIGLDCYIDPLHPDHADGYAAVHADLLRRAVASGAAEQVLEKFPVSTGSGRYVIGGWLLGKCPNCRAPAGGNACEQCGYHFQPSEILEPRSRLDEGPIAWRPESCWFMVPKQADAVRDAIVAGNVPGPLVETAVRYLQKTGGRVRLTMPSEWGIPSASGGKTVLCNPYFGYCLYLSELYGAMTGGGNALGLQSDVSVVALFGIDNAIAGLVVPHVAAQCHGAVRPFDRTTVNYFLTLEGSKFSTSRRHAIWVSDMIRRTSVTADELRYFLTGVCAEDDAADFRIADFVAATDRLRRHMAQTVLPTLRTLAGAPPPPEPLLKHLKFLVGRQSQCLDPDRLRLRSSVVPLDEWLNRTGSAASRPEDAYWWLSGLALLAEPIMPGLAGWLWSSLGRDGRPRLDAIGQSGTPRIPADIWVPQPLGMAEILPHASLTAAA